MEEQKYIDYIFELNVDLKPSIVNEDYIIIDNVYKNFIELNNYLVSIDKQLRSRRTDEYLNFRTKLPFKPNSKNILNNIILHYGREHFNKHYEIMDGDDSTFNSIKLRVPKKDGFQHWPHIDPGITGIVYLDMFENGGTAIYENNSGKDLPETLLPGKGYFRDISELDLIDVVKAKPNRLVIFNATKLHGGYIEDSKVYMENERIHQIAFTGLPE